MSLCVENRCTCPSPVIVEIPGAPGEDYANLEPDVVEPDGVKIAEKAGQFYYNSALGKLYIALAVGSGDWECIIGGPA